MVFVKATNEFSVFMTCFKATVHFFLFAVILYPKQVITGKSPTFLCTCLAADSKANTLLSILSQENVRAYEVHPN
jgi:ATP/ADP translocase